MVENFNTENLPVKVFPDRKTMGVAAALHVCNTIKQLLENKSTINVIFAAAPSQNELLENLYTSNDVEWQRIYAFHMDEYIGLDAAAPQGFGNFLKHRLFSKLPFKNVFYIDGNAEDIELEVLRYKNLLEKYPPDLVCMGIGENGHIAFNDPPVANFNDLEVIKVVELEEACRQQQVNDGCFQELEDVPKHALTLTIPTLINADCIVCVVPGKHKAKAVHNTLFQPILEKFPSTILRNHPNTTLYLDKESSELLKIKFTSTNTLT